MANLICRAGKINMTILHFHFNITIDSLLQFTLGSLNRNNILITNGNGYTAWNLNWFFSYTRHSSSKMRQFESENGIKLSVENFLLQTWKSFSLFPICYLRINTRNTKPLHPRSGP